MARTKKLDRDNPIWTPAEFRRAKPASDVLPKLIGAAAAQELLRKPGQRGPGKRPAKIAVSIRLDPDIVARFKAKGPGWQSRINATLRKALKAA